MSDPIAPARGCCSGCAISLALGLLLVACWALAPSLLR